MKKKVRIEIEPFKARLLQDLPLDPQHGAVEGLEVEIVAEWREASKSGGGPGRHVRYEFINKDGDPIGVFDREFERIT